MAARQDIIAFLDDLLDAAAFEDYGPNGLQVVGAEEVTTVVTGVSAHLETLRREARAWNRRMNRDRIKINWKFDRKAARRKFGYKRKSFKRS